MKKFLRRYYLHLLWISLFINQNNYAQSESNPWVFGIGANAIDFFPTNAPNTGNDNGFLNELFNVEDHWNISGPQLLVTRHLIKNLSVDGILAFNQITKYGDVTVDKTTYIGMDINVRYSFIDTSKDFTVFALAGGGYTFALSSGGTVNAGIGANYWFTNTLGLNFETFYKYNSSNFKLPPHFYYGLSLVFRVNSADPEDWRNCQ